MPPALLASQLATLEPLQPDERGATLDLALPVADLVAAARGVLLEERSGPSDGS